MKNQTDYKELNRLLHHPSQNDVKFGQDMQAKQHVEHQKGNAPIKRYVALVLVKLMIKKLRYYNNYDYTDSLTAKNCDTNTSALLRSLESIKFVTILKKHQLKHSTQTIAKLTPLGRKYVQNYIPRYKQIYRYLKHGKTSMKLTDRSSKSMLNRVTYWSLVVCGFVLAFVWLAVASEFLSEFLVTSICMKMPFLLFILLFLSFAIMFQIPYGLPNIVNFIIKKKDIFYKNENVSKDIHKATRGRFIKFLKVNHIQEPDYRFGYNNDLPKIDCYLFDNKGGLD